MVYYIPVVSIPRTWIDSNLPSDYDFTTYEGIYTTITLTKPHITGNYNPEDIEFDDAADKLVDFYKKELTKKKELYILEDLTEKNAHKAIQDFLNSLESNKIKNSPCLSFLVKSIIIK